jgi:hypothetical protein
MKPLRIFLAGLAAVCALLAALACVALSSRFQTWAVRQVLAKRPQWRVSLGSLSVGPGEVDLADVRVARGGAVLVLPSLRAEFPVLSVGLGRSLIVHRLAASGWTLDLSGVPFRRSAALGQLTEFAVLPPAGRVRPRPPSFLSSAYADDPPAAAALQVFQGLFHQLRLPVDFQLDALDLQGDVILPPAPGAVPVRVHVALSGGGLSAGREGVFTFSVRSSAPEASAVSTVTGEGTLAAAMDTPRTFSRLAIKLDASATGGRIPAGAKLTANLVAARSATGESYDLTLAGQNKQLVAVRAALADESHALAGTWKLDVGDDDLAPFALGRPLPIFTAAGGGSFDTDATLARLHASGSLSATADQLGVLRPGLAAVGAVRLTTAFDVAHHGGELRVDRLSLDLSGVRPIATVNALQPFTFNVPTGELKVANPAGDLLGIDLENVPAAWAQPFLHALVVTGGDLRGHLGVSARAGGLGLRSTEPLAVTGLSATRAGQPLLGGVDVSLVLSADYAPQGWVLAIKPCTASRGDARLLTFEASVGRLAGADQPVKATGRIEADLAVLAQAGSGPRRALTRGEFASDFTVVLGVQRGYQARFTISDLAVAASSALPNPPAAWPTVTGEIRADVDAAGKCALVMPLTFAAGDRKSDVTLAGSLAPAGNGWVIDGRLTGGLLFADDLELLAGAFALGDGTPDGAAPASVIGAPFWSGVDGHVVLGLKEVRLEQSDWSGLQGALHLTPSALELENLRASVATGGDVTLGGTLFFAAGPSPYTLKASLGVSDFDFGAFARAQHPGRAPAVEGKFRIAGQVSGEARDLAGLADGLQGDFQLSSKSGLFRALQANVADSLKQSPALISQTIDSIGSFLGMKGEKTEDAKRLLDKQGKLVVALTDRLREVPYDQINIVARRGANLDVRCTEFALIAPELRISGTGLIAHLKEGRIADQPLTFDGELSARGGLAASLNGLGLLGDQRDDLGYTKMSQPFHLGGTLNDPDGTQWEETLVKSALHKATGGLLDKLLGK